MRCGCKTPKRLGCSCTSGRQERKSTRPLPSVIGEGARERMKELYALSSYALRDLLELWDYIRKDDPETADRVEAELLRKKRNLADRR